MTSKTCQHCGSHFTPRRKEGQKRFTQRRYCGSECAHASLKDTGQTKQCRHCGQTFTRKPDKRTGDWNRLLFCSRTCVSASRTHQTPSRRALHARAAKHRKPACEHCGTARTLIVHHKDRDVNNNDPTNLQTLCQPCHVRAHWADPTFRAQMLTSRHRRTTQPASGYKGVRASGSKWQAQIWTNNQRFYLGLFTTPEEAAWAYDQAARSLHGELASLNFRELAP